MSLLDGTAGRKDGEKIVAGSDLLGGLRGSFMQTAADAPAPKADLRTRALTFALVLVVESIVIGAAYGTMAFLISRRSAEKSAIEQTVIAENSKLAAKAEEVKKAAVFNAQTIAADAALDGHIRWTDFFSFLEERTKPSVKYVNFTGDADTGLVSVDAVGATYRDVAEQIVVFREDPLVADVRAATASAQLSDSGELIGVAFTMGIKLKKDLWLGAYTPARSTTSAQAAAVSLDCGTSSNASDAAAKCFVSKVAACAPATVTAASTLGSGKYLVVGPAASGCRVSFTYAADIFLADYAGKVYECIYDTALDFWAQTGKTLDGCTGSLIDALTPTASSAERTIP